MSALPAKKLPLNEVLETLKQFSFFKTLPPDLIQQVAGMAQYIKLNGGENLLTQGQNNSLLYILIQGEASVLVDGVKVAKVNWPGDLIGEMSVISKRPCSATVQASDGMEVYIIDAGALSHASGPEADRLQHILYRIYSQVLVKRLEETNQKAKRIEEMNLRLERAKDDLRVANDELEQRVKERTTELTRKTEDLTAANTKLEARNAEVMASHRKLEELYANRSSTMNHLQRLLREHLIPLDGQLDELSKGLNKEQKEITEKAQAAVHRAVDMLEPMTTLYSTELAMRSKRVLLADSDKKQQIVAKLALGGTGVGLEIAPSEEEARQAAKAGVDIIFVDRAMLDLASVAVAANPNCKVVLMTSEYIPNYLPDLLKLDFMPNIVSRSEDDRTFTIKNIGTTVSKLISHDLFGLEKYLAWGTEVKELPVVRSDQRGFLISQMDSDLEGLGVRRTTRERMATVAEELLMNAIYDAPVGKDGKSLFNHLPRTELLELKPEHQALMRYASDGMFTAISVEDPFGALSGSTILKYLQSCYGGQAGELNKAKGGAGRGLHQIVENSDLVVFNLRPGKRTEVIALFNVDPKSNPIEYPTFHLFIS